MIKIQCIVCIYEWFHFNKLSFTSHGKAWSFSDPDWFPLPLLEERGRQYFWLNVQCSYIWIDAWDLEILLTCFHTERKSLFLPCWWWFVWTSPFLAPHPHTVLVLKSYHLLGRYSNYPILSCESVDLAQHTYSLLQNNLLSWLRCKFQCHSYHSLLGQFRHMGPVIWGGWGNPNISSKNVKEARRYGLLNGVVNSHVLAGGLGPHSADGLFVGTGKGTGAIYVIAN